MKAYLFVRMTEEARCWHGLLATLRRMKSVKQIDRVDGDMADLVGLIVVADQDELYWVTSTIRHTWGVASVSACIVVEQPPIVLEELEEGKGWYVIVNPDHPQASTIAICLQSAPGLWPRMLKDYDLLEEAEHLLQEALDAWEQLLCKVEVASHPREPVEASG